MAEDPRTPTRSGGSSALGTYYDGLDGLRAFSVVAVLLFHGLGVSGGFLGVSQFFTLSGFLITAMLVRAQDRGGVELRPFWGRRLRRLVPASLLAMALIVVYSATAADLAQVEALPGEVVAALLWVFNWYVLASDGSYVDLFSAPSPMEHYWSLSLEEQFYLLISFGFVLVTRVTSSGRALVGILGAAAVASAVWSVVLYRGGAGLDRVYLGTDTRAAELLVGAVLAVVVVRRLQEPTGAERRLFAGAGALAFVLAVTAWFVVDMAPGPFWNGGFALYAVLTATVILGALARQGPLVWVLTFGPIPALGRVAYGVYLYHWPVFLWLDEERTGLDRPALFALRSVVTVAAAAASYHFVERPVIERRWSGAPRWLRLSWAPLAAVGLVVACVTVSTRDAPDPSATFRVDDASLAVPVLPEDEVMDVLAIVDEPGAEVVARMAELGAAGVDGLEAEVTTVPFGCTSVVQHEGVDLCREWADTWPALVADVDPDVVLVQVRTWPGADISAASGRPPQEAQVAATALLGAGFDVLTSRGAPVVLSRGPLTFAEELAMVDEPYDRALRTLERQRDDLRLRDVDPALSAEDRLDAEASALLSDLALYQRAQHRLPRVMVVGDSMARSIGFGLERWAVQEDRALVWNVAAPGCGLSPTVGGATECDGVLERLPARVEDFDPDLVLVLTSAWDLVEREVPGADGVVGIDDAAFAAFLRDAYLDVAEVLGGDGATVVWMTAPCSSDADSAVSGGHPAVLAEFNSRVVDPLVADAGADVRGFDLAEVLCPDGAPLEAVDGVEQLRSDGIHFSVEGSMWFAETYGPELLALGGI